METSDWITIYSMVATVLMTTIGSALYVSFKIGGSDEKMISMAISIDKLERNTKELRDDMTLLRSDVSEIRVDMTEMKVKVGELWRDYVDRR
jgi:hypothetical protein